MYDSGWMHSQDNLSQGFPYRSPAPPTGATRSVAVAARRDHMQKRRRDQGNHTEAGLDQDPQDLRGRRQGGHRGCDHAEGHNLQAGARATALLWGFLRRRRPPTRKQYRMTIRSTLYKKMYIIFLPIPHLLLKLWLLLLWREPSVGRTNEPRGG